MVDNHEQNRPELVAERLRGNINFEAEDDFFFRGKPSATTNLMRNAIAAVAVMGTMIGGFFIYHQRVDQARPTSVAVIKADEGPIKITPSDPGGMKVPHLEMSVYDNISTDKKPNEKTAEQILPAPEKPIDLEAIARAMAEKKAMELVSKNSAQDANKIEAEVEETKHVSAEVSTPKEIAAAAATAVMPEAKNVNVDPAPAATAAQAPSVVAEAQPVAKVEAPKTAPKVVFIDENNRPAELKLPKASAENTEEQPVIKLSNNQPQAKGYYVQLAAFRSSGTAKQSWQEISSKHTDLLGKFSPVISAKNMPDGSIFYRLQAGPVVSMTEARKLCIQLGKRNQNCFVSKKD